jgi:adenylosuccinate synthase
MSVVIVVGAQWGDEGKGKVVDLFTERADLVVRYGGGANAGHTLVIDGQKLVTHLVPSGVCHPGKSCVLGDGMVIDPQTLLEELAMCQARGLLSRGELLIGLGAHVILPYHKRIDALREDRGARTGRALGTTRRGIGPAYEAKAARRGVRVRDLMKPARLRELVAANLDELVPLIEHLGGGRPGPEEVARWIDDALAAGRALAPHTGDAGRHVASAIASGLHVLFEGAQGCLLDLDHGTYPYVTSSSTIAAGACQSAGIGPTAIDAVVGITKAYATRVGAGPFPTELHGELGERLRKAGGEYGATTGRPRRCGWFDAAALRRSIQINGVSGLAITKLDVLDGMERVRLCTGYRADGAMHDLLPLGAEDAARCRPVYEDLPGWRESTVGVSSYEKLPAEARAYLERLQSVCGVPIDMISTGADRNETIVLRHPFH